MRSPYRLPWTLCWLSFDDGIEATDRETRAPPALGSAPARAGHRVRLLAAYTTRASAAGGDAGAGAAVAGADPQLTVMRIMRSKASRRTEEPPESNGAGAAVSGWL
jgi:hypothetical protein